MRPLLLKASAHSPPPPLISSSSSISFIRGKTPINIFQIFLISALSFCFLSFITVVLPLLSHPLSFFSFLSFCPSISSNSLLSFVSFTPSLLFFSGFLSAEEWCHKFVHLCLLSPRPSVFTDSVLLSHFFYHHEEILFWKWFIFMFFI